MCIKYLTFIFAYILTANPFLYWESLSKEDQNEIIQDDKTDTKVRDLFFGHFKLGDNTQTKILLDTLTKLPINVKYKALYFNLYNQISYKADGALVKILANPCQAILLSDPVYVMNYLKKILYY